jgi:tRNA nucleotidyltransferase/poly(A) polymerase
MMLSFDTNIFPYKRGVYIVGGSIRDLLSDRKPFDYDVVVQDDPAFFAKRLAAKTSGRLVELGKRGQTIRRIVTEDLLFDVMPLNGATIEEDLLQRDFTINAMAVAVSSGHLIDPLGGRQDLASKRIRMVSVDVFRKDPVRLVRAYRLTAVFDLSIDVDTHRVLARDAHLISRSAGERVREEFFKILQCAASHACLAGMARSGLLFNVFPELLALKNYRMPGVHPHNLFEQTIDSYHGLEKLLDAGGWLDKVSGDRLFQDVDAARATLLKWAILFHDIGLPTAQTIIEEPNIHFNSHALKNAAMAPKHALKSAAMARNICQRLRFSRRQTDTIGLIIVNHLKPFYLFQAQQKKLSFQKAFIRFFRQCRDLTPDILLHALAEFMGKKDDQDPILREFAEFIRTLIQDYYSVLQPRSSLPPPLTGNDLINEFGLKPSAHFKRILERVDQERLTKPVLTRQQALKLVEELIK